MINQESKRINDGLQQIAGMKCYQDIVFVDNDNDFQPEGCIQRQLLSRDGLHLSFRGTETVVQRLESEIHRAFMNRPVASQPLKSASNPPRKETCKTTSSLKETEQETKDEVDKGAVSKSEEKSIPTQFEAVPQKPVREPRQEKLKMPLKRKTAVPAVVCSTPWWQSASSPNMFQLLSIEDYDEPAEDEENDSNLFTLISPYDKRTLLTGGGVGSEETDADFSSVIYAERETKFKHSEAADILDNPDVEKVSKFPPFKPKGGTVYVISDGQNSKHMDDWRSDGYTWRNYGKNKVTNGDKVLEKSYFRIKNGKEENNNFQRVMYRFFGNDYTSFTLIQYLGDEKQYKERPHGNCINGVRPHLRTMPSVLRKIKDSGDANPKTVKDKLDSENPVPLKFTGVYSVRNCKQVKNVQFNNRKERKLGHDSLYNLHELMYNLDSYIHEIKTGPDLQVIIGYKDIFEEYGRLLQLKTDDPIPLYYDTTFCLGDFYVSTLEFQHVMFEEKPVIPLAFMVHERKFQKCHEQFLDLIKEKIPNLERKNVPIVTDRETGIVNAFTKILPNSKLLICWNHILRDLKFWLSKHGGTPVDLKVYDNTLGSFCDVNHRKSSNSFMKP